MQDGERKTSQKMRKSRSVLTVSPNEVSTSRAGLMGQKNSPAIFGPGGPPLQFRIYIYIYILWVGGWMDA